MKAFAILVLLLAALVSAPAHAKLKVFACEPEWASLVKELAGDKVDIDVGTSALQDVHVTDMSLLSSDAIGKLMLVNPLGFDVRIADMRYTLLAENEPVGEGSARGLILRGGRKNILSLPIAIDHAALLSAAGKAVAAGGDIAVRLQGQLTLRLKGGDVTVPLNLSGHLTGAS